jgi:hypothetical protein
MRVTGRGRHLGLRLEALPGEGQVLHLLIGERHFDAVDGFGLWLWLIIAGEDVSVMDLRMCKLNVEGCKLKYEPRQPTGGPDGSCDQKHVKVWAVCLE